MSCVRGTLIHDDSSPLRSRKLQVCTSVAQERGVPLAPATAEVRSVFDLGLDAHGPRSGARIPVRTECICANHGVRVGDIVNESGERPIFRQGYNRVRFRLEGEVVKQRHYSGTFDADDPQSLAALLAREADLEIREREEEYIIRGLPKLNEEVQRK